MKLPTWWPWSVEAKRKRKGWLKRALRAVADWLDGELEGR